MQWLGKGIAIAGIWIGIALLGKWAGEGAVVAAMFGMFATFAICVSRG